MLRMRANFRGWNYGRNTRSTNNLVTKERSDFRISTQFLFTLNIPPTWRRVTTITPMTSLHLVRNSFWRVRCLLLTLPVSHL